jgi:drug/metabolite transporter (DMT)-like permease
MSSRLINPLQATLAGILSCLIWSAAVLVMSLLATTFGPLRAGALELGIAGIILAISAWVRGDIRRIGMHSRLCHLVCGTFWILNLTLAYLAISLVHSKGELLVTGLLNYLWPSLTLLLAIPILHKRANAWLLPGMAAVLVGIVLGKLATAPEGASHDALMHLNPWAYSCAVLDAIAWALYSNYSRRLSHPDGASAVPIYMIIGSLLLLGANLFIANEPRSPTTLDWGIMIAWSFGAALAYLFWDVGMRFGNVVTISTTSMLIPLLSTIITAYLSGHEISTTLLIAAALVVVGSRICRKGVV